MCISVGTPSALAMDGGREIQYLVVRHLYQKLKMSALTLAKFNPKIFAI